MCKCMVKEVKEQIKNISRDVSDREYQIYKIKCLAKVNGGLGCGKDHEHERRQ